MAVEVAFVYLLRWKTICNEDSMNFFYGLSAVYCTDDVKKKCHGSS